LQGLDFILALSQCNIVEYLTVLELLKRKGKKKKKTSVGTKLVQIQFFSGLSGNNIRE